MLRFFPDDQFNNWLELNQTELDETYEELLQLSGRYGIILVDNMQTYNGFLIMMYKNYN